MNTLDETDKNLNVLACSPKAVQIIYRGFPPLSEIN